MFRRGFRFGYLLGPLLMPALTLILVLTLLAQIKVEPSSHITAIDLRTGMVSAKVNATGEDFQFTLNDSSLLGTLKVGQGVYANFRAKQLSLDGQHVVGKIVSIGAAKGPLAAAAPEGRINAPLPAKPSASPKPASGTPGTAAQQITPPPDSGANPACCSITSIDAPARLVSAKENSVGQAFEFSVPNSLLIQNLHTGQPVWANFKTRKVSLNGESACCDIMSVGTSSLGSASGTTAKQNLSNQVQGMKACCKIVTLDPKTGLATVKETATGRTFQLRVADARQLASLRTAQTVNIATPTSRGPQVSTEELAETRASAETIHVAPPPFDSADRKLGHWFFKHGGAFHRSTVPTRPAILLFHGLHGTANAWMSPADDPGVGGYFYDFRDTPPQVREESSTPNEGIFKVGKSDRSAAKVNANNWFGFLVSQNFTVATWTQPLETFDQAYPSAQEAYAQFLSVTQAMNPAPPPPVALLGHSRGGLLIRKLLNDYQGSGGRVKWVITLHSPHSGSELAQAPEKLRTDVETLCSTPIVVEGLEPWAATTSVMCYGSLESFIKDQLKDGQRELAPGGHVVSEVVAGETRLQGVTYFTFGGTSPTYLRFYAWLLTPSSGVPQFKCDHSLPPNCEVYFEWKANASELPGISPMFNALPDHFVPEITPGKGDGLVADARARLPFESIHITDQLNHAEVLWDRNLQEQIVQILSGVRLRPRSGMAEVEMK